MTATDLVVLAVAASLVVLGLLWVALLRVRRAATRTAAELARARAECDGLRARLEMLEEALAAERAPEPEPRLGQEFVITHVGERAPADAPTEGSAPRIEGRLFADLVLRESVVKAASVAYGVRRAVSPEVRDRIRLEMRREVRRARRRRRVDLRELRRELRREQRRLDQEEVA